MIQIHTFKEEKKNEAKENHNLVASGRFQAYWPLEGIQCLEVNGETSCLVAFGRINRSILFISFHFPP
jgi:hypothetical protein